LAEDGTQALDTLTTESFDLALLDNRMPGLTGLEVLTQFRQTNPDNPLKLIALSASVLEHQRQEFLDAGFDAFIGKPFHFDQICAVMGDLLDIEFEYEEQAIDGASAATEPTDWSQVAIPDALRQELLAAAQLYSVTALEKGFKELDALGGDAADLAAHFRELRQ